MRKYLLLACSALLFFAGTALADNLDGRFGITGKAGALVPLKSDFVSGSSGSKTGLTAGGGLIFGIGRNMAAEVDVSHAFNLDVESSGSKVFDATLDDIALGIQYRFTPDSRLVPFVGAGADFFRGTLKSVSGTGYDLDWTEGGHLNVGVDYFLGRSVALSAEARAVIGVKGDIKGGGTKVGEYDPRSFIGTIGIRLILPKSSSW